jgi:hypothetical protein
MAGSPKLTQRKGKRLAGGKPIAKGDFALPGQRYPIDTPGRARNALARGAQNATPAEQATIKRKVAAKYPAIAVGGKKTATKKAAGKKAPFGGKKAAPFTSKKSK